jgi:hypothetical protein
VIGAGGAVMQAMLRGLRAVPGLEVSHDLVTAATDRALLAGARVVLDEVPAPGQSSLPPALRLALAPSCAVIRLPRPALTALWPLAGESAEQREATPFADRLAAHIAVAGAAPEEAAAAYASVPISALVDLDTALADDMQLLLAREQGCEVRLAAFVLSQFRTQRLFHAAAQPAGPLLRLALAQMLTHPALAALLEVPLDLALAAAGAVLDHSFAEEEAPVHPGVAAHFALSWWGPALTYRRGERCGDGPAWVGWMLHDARPPPPPPPAVTLHAGGVIERVAPFFATWINPEVAPRGAALLEASAARYDAPPMTLATLPEATVNGRSGTLALHAPSGARRLPGTTMLGFGPDWRSDNGGFATLLPRLVAFARLRRRDDAARILLPQGADSPWLAEVLALLALSPPEIEWLGDTPVDCDVLLTLSGLDTDAVSPAVAQAARTLAGLVPLGPTRPDRIFLFAGGGGPGNLGDCAETLTRRGFVAVNADSLDLPSRIALLREATALVAPQGSALDEMAFLPPGAAVLELTGPADPRARYWSIASVCGLRYGYVVGDAADGTYTIPLAMLEAAAAAMG